MATEEDIQKAIDAYRTGVFPSARQAAKHYGVPQTTIQRRLIKDAVTRSEATSRPRKYETALSKRRYRSMLMDLQKPPLV